MFPLPLQYFEYTSEKEIRFNSVTELCAEVLDGQPAIGMRHCPRDGEVRSPSVLWEFRSVRAAHRKHSTHGSHVQEELVELFDRKNVVEKGCLGHFMN